MHPASSGVSSVMWHALGCQEAAVELQAQSYIHFITRTLTWKSAKHPAELAGHLHGHLYLVFTHPVSRAGLMEAQACRMRRDTAGVADGPCPKGCVGCICLHQEMTSWENAKGSRWSGRRILPLAIQ